MKTDPPGASGTRIMEVRPDSVQSRDRQLEAAISVLQSAAAAERTQGILITRHRPDLYTAELHEAVPYGLTRQRVLETLPGSKES